MKNPLYLANLSCLSFAAGVFLTASGMILYGFAAAALLGALCIAVLYYKKRSVLRGCFLAGTLLLVFFLAGGVRFFWAQQLCIDDLAPYLNCEVEIKGNIDGQAREFIQPDGRSRVYYTVALTELTYGGKARRIGGKIEVSCKKKSGETVGRYGDEITAYGALQEIRFYKNPGQLDRREMKLRQGVAARMIAKDAKLTPREAWSFARSIHSFRARVLTAMEKAMPKEDAAALFAMLFGGYQGIDEKMLDAFTATGIVHILSVSGSHVTLLAGTVEKLSAIYRLSRLWRLAAISSVILAYGAAAGFVTPVVRSAFMGMLVYTADALGRERDSKFALVYAALAMLMMQPALLFDISFLLSFLATAGLLYIAPVLMEWLRPLPRFLASGLAVTAAAQIASLPVLAWYFNTVSISSLAANLLLTPLIEYLIVLSLAAVLLSFLLPPLAQVALAFGSILLGVIAEGAKLLAALPFSMVFVPSLNVCGGTIYYGIVLAVCFISRPLLTAGAKLCMILTTVAFWQLYSLWPQAAEVHFIDVGQGDAMLVLTPHRRALLFDAGGIRDSAFDVGEKVVVPYLRHFNVQHLEYLVLTHAHDDHAGGAGAVLRRIDVRHLLTADEGPKVYAAAMKVKPSEIERRWISAQEGQCFTVDGVTVQVLYAGQRTEDAATGNEISNVYRVSADGVSVLITGDIDAAGEADMVQRDMAMQTDILKVAHHGSKTSSTQDFLDAVRPDYAIISVGVGNSFGHPNQAVLERLKKVGAAVYRTDEVGAIVCKLLKGRVFLSTYEENARKFF